MKQLAQNEAEAINLAQNGINMFLMVGAFEVQKDESTAYEYFDPTGYLDINVRQA